MDIRGGKNLDNFFGEDVERRTITIESRFDPEELRSAPGLYLIKTGGVIGYVRNFDDLDVYLVPTNQKDFEIMYLAHYVRSKK